MPRHAHALLITALIFAATPLVAQSRSENDDRKFWNHFEDEVNDFVDKVLLEFQAPPRDSVLHAQSAPATERTILVIVHDSTIAPGDTLN